MRLGLHFEIADTPPLISEEITEKSEIYQDLGFGVPHPSQPSASSAWKLRGGLDKV